MTDPNPVCQTCGKPATTEYDYGRKFYTCEEHQIQGGFYGAVRSLPAANPIGKVRGTNPGT